LLSEKGQLSVEMLVVLVVILGVVALVAGIIMNSANQAANEAGKRANATLGECISNSQHCGAPSECCSRNCRSGICEAPLG